MPGNPVDPSQPVIAVCPNCEQRVELIWFQRINGLCWPVHLIRPPMSLWDFMLDNVCPLGINAVTIAVDVANFQPGGTDGPQD